MLAQRTRLFGASGTAGARAAAKAAADAGHDIVDLTAGEIWSDLAPSIRDGAIAAIRADVSRYTDTVGAPELREAVAAKLARETGQSWRASEVAMTAGAKQALFNAAMTVLDPGDEVIIPSPYWTTFPAQVLLAGGVPVFVRSPRPDYVPRLADIERALTARTRAIIVNTPGNPTGAVFDREMLAGIAALAIERDLWVIFDECYGSFVHGSAAHHPIVALVPDVRPRTLIVNAFSKALALTGWRIGYLAGPAELIGAAKALQSHTTSNPNVIAQHAVLAHLRQGDGGAEHALAARLTTARQIGLEALSGLRHVPAPKARGGFYFYLDLSSLPNMTGRTADDVAHELLEKAGVAAVSGVAFGDPMALRLSYGVPPDRLETGLGRLVAFLNAFE